MLTIWKTYAHVLENICSHFGEIRRMDALICGNRYSLIIC